jgi:hypothetical protein
LRFMPVFTVNRWEKSITCKVMEQAADFNQCLCFTGPECNRELCDEVRQA